MLSNFILSQDFTAGDIITLNVNDYSLIESNHAPVVLTMKSSVVGTPVAAVSNSDMFIRLSSIVPKHKSREVTARISSGSIPLGTKLTIIAAPCTLANSGGKLGRVKVDPISLSSVDQNIIKKIGSCYTGTGYNDGYQITYNWESSNLSADYALIKATSSPVYITVVYTISSYY